MACFQKMRQFPLVGDSSVKKFHSDPGSLANAPSPAPDSFVYYGVVLFLVFLRILLFPFFFKKKGWSSMLPDRLLPPENLSELPKLSEKEIKILNDKMNTRKTIERWILAIYLSESNKRPKGRRPRGLLSYDKKGFQTSRR